jgi:hypothetical protein
VEVGVLLEMYLVYKLKLINFRFDRIQTEISNRGPVEYFIMSENKSLGLRKGLMIVEKIGFILVQL